MVWLKTSLVSVKTSLPSWVVQTNPVSELPPVARGCGGRSPCPPWPLRQHPSRLLVREPQVVRPRLPGPPGVRVLLCRLYEDKGEADFMESLLQLFRSISDMMSSVSDQTVRVKVGPRVQKDGPPSGHPTGLPGQGERRRACLAKHEPEKQPRGGI